MSTTFYKEVKKVTDHIIHIVYYDQEDCGDAFLRFQEHYESPNPNFRGKIFTTGQYRDWYSQENGGNTYQIDWGGYNVPSYVFDPFVKGLFDPLDDDEAEIVDLVRYRTDKFYVIGTYVGGEESIDHEVCHGLYYTVPKYKEAVDAVLDEWDLSELEEYILGLGYCQEVLKDECHAYVSADPDYLEENGVIIGKELHNALRRIKKRFFKN